jgi:hypothetical protein
MLEITAHEAFSVLQAESRVVSFYAIDSLFHGTDKMVFLESQTTTEISNQRTDSQWRPV